MAKATPTKAKKPVPGGTIGVGASLSAGLGIFMQGLQGQISVFGKPGSIGKLSFSLSVPSNPIYIDASASVQLLAGYTKNNRFDLSGWGESVGIGA